MEKHQEQTYKIQCLYVKLRAHVLEKVADASKLDFQNMNGGLEY